MKLKLAAASILSALLLTTMACTNTQATDAQDAGGRNVTATATTNDNPIWDDSLPVLPA